jgi:hypothetical protein
VASDALGLIVRRANLSASHRSDRAADMRMLSQESNDQAFKVLLLKMADDYDTFAAHRDLPSKTALRNETVQD